MKSLTLGALLSFLFLSVYQARAAGGEDRPFQILTGLTQPILLKGANIAFNYSFKNGIVIESSWGFALDYESTLSAKDKNNYGSVKSPLSGGLGIGYMPIKNLKVLWEPKFTNFSITPGLGDEFDYTVYSAGVGIYYDIYIWKGLVLQPAVKYWPRISSTLNANKKAYLDKDGNQKTHEARSPGNNGFILNASLGWAF